MEGPYRKLDAELEDQTFRNLNEKRLEDKAHERLNWAENLLVWKKNLQLPVQCMGQQVLSALVIPAGLSHKDLQVLLKRQICRGRCPCSWLKCLWESGVLKWP